MQRSIVYSKIQVVTHHYQRFSCSQYFLLVQVQVEQKRLINSRLGDATLTLKKRNTVQVFTHRLARIFQSIFGSAHLR
ncbi:hypothetical protein H5410_045570 [Solanum commersonii]|uniref:Uncharacterized protein n=1 Tax=Solanum commersonii TaxID=4109 RepID=A0A9J5XE20_SOLCO|nr:hypothetical protein H5410_045570 [Solanum commersonii]